MLRYDFEQSVGFWLVRAWTAYERALNAELIPRGITFRRAQVLGCLALHGSLSQSELSERMHVEPPTLVGILDRMERDEWITREDCPTDRRKKLIRATKRAEPTWSEVVELVEVRAITDDGVASGYFNDPAALANAVSPLDTLPSVQGIYVTLNEVNPALLSRRANRVKMRLSKKDATTADADIIRRRWLPVDVDPVRPSGVSSTEAEHRCCDGESGPDRGCTLMTSGGRHRLSPTAGTVPTSCTALICRTTRSPGSGKEVPGSARGDVRRSGEHHRHDRPQPGDGSGSCTARCAGRATIRKTVRTGGPWSVLSRPGLM